MIGTSQHRYEKSCWDRSLAFQSLADMAIGRGFYANDKRRLS